MYFIHTHRRDLLMSVRLLNIRSCYTVHPLIATWFPAVIGCVHLLFCSRFQAGSVESAVCSRCASALVTSSPSAQTHRLLPISLEPNKIFVISGIEGQQIFSRTRRSKCTSPNHSRRYNLSTLWITFHGFATFVSKSHHMCCRQSLFGLSQANDTVR